MAASEGLTIALDFNPARGEISPSYLKKKKKKKAVRLARSDPCFFQSFARIHRSFPFSCLPPSPSGGDASLPACGQEQSHPELKSAPDTMRP